MYDPNKHLIKIQGNRQYLPVSARLVWFRDVHPDWGITTAPQILDIERQVAVFHATITDAQGHIVAQGVKMEDVRGFADYVEKAETGAIGRALAVAGFGTQFAPEMDEVTGARYVDSPQESPRPEQRDVPKAEAMRNWNAVYQQLTDDARRGLPAAIAKTFPGKHQVGELSADEVNQLIALYVPAEERSTPPSHICNACSRELTASQEALSMRKYGLPLCPACQKERTDLQNRD